VETAALARALAVQLLATCSPAQYRVRGDAAWLDALPHAREPGTIGTIELLDDSTRILIATARDPAALPATVESLVRVDGAEGTVDGQSFRPEFLSAEEALAWAGRAATIARAHGICDTQGAPSVARFAELPADPASGLACAIGVDAEGPVLVDLVADGPHAIVGGTTGSGKSELLITWLISMARVHSPADLNILLFDFKGGSSFGDVVALPHCVGLLTDLDAPSAERAVASLGAELRHRERVLAAASARSIDEVPALPRLVIVVDEFAAMAADLPELHTLFADLAARGRSLGVHLVLCTQRPAGVVRDSVLANASLRISLRVNNRSDSIAVIGTGEAVATGVAPPGRAWLTRAGEAPAALQVAIATRAEIAEVTQLWPESEAPRRPWCDPLPTVLTLSGESGAIGLIDRPGEQSQPPLRWDPRVDGNLLALGAAGSGRTTLLHAIAHSSDATLVDADSEALWDAVLAPPANPLLIDDLDLLVARMPADYQQAFTEQLATTLRAGSSHFAITVQRLTGPIQALGSLCNSRLLLGMPNRQEHVIAGGSSQTFDPDLPPGGGHWRESRVQIALAPAVSRVARATSVPFVARGLTLAVSPHATTLAARLAAAGHDVATNPSASTGIVVTDPDGWHANWATFSALAKQHDVLFHDCSVAEFRQLARLRILPPLIADPLKSGWLLTPDGSVERVTI
jgi:S-DNA-T family DNA segregation ATPase FtsK/SpoIIIE